MSSSYSINDILPKEMLGEIFTWLNNNNNNNVYFHFDFEHETYTVSKNQWLVPSDAYMSFMESTGKKNIQSNSGK